jgi:O-antigen/teichoic acid export membrane protein
VTSRSRAAGRVGLRLSAEVLGRALQFVVVVVVARTLPPEQFGLLMVGFTAGLVLGQISDLGLSLIVAADATRAEGGLAGRIASALAVKLVLLGVVALGLLGIVANAGGSGPVIGAAMVALALALDSIVQFVGWQLRATGHFVYDWVVALVPRIAVALVVVPVGVAGLGEIAIGIAWLAGSVVAAAFALVALRRHVPFWGPTVDVARQLLARSWPIGGSIVAAMLYSRVALLVLQVMAPGPQVGEYAAAGRLLDPTYLIPAALANVFYPAFSTATAQGRAGSSTLRSWLLLAGLAGTAVTLVLFLASSTLVAVIYGPAYAGAVPILRILALIPMFGFPSYLMNQALAARGQAIVAFWTSIVLLVGAVVTQPLALEAAGAVGVAACSVAIEIILFGTFMLALRRRWRMTA